MNFVEESDMLIKINNDEFFNLFRAQGIEVSPERMAFLSTDERFLARVAEDLLMVLEGEGGDLSEVYEEFFPYTEDSE